MVIVLTMLVVLSVIVVPLVFSAMRRSQLNACAEQVASHIRYARSMAMAGGLGNVQIAFTTGATSRYEVWSCGMAAYLQDPLDRTNSFDGTNSFRVGLGNPPIASTREEFKFITFTAGVAPAFLVFDATGTPFTAAASCGALTALAAPSEVRLQNPSGNTRSIFVTRTTGTVFVGTP